MMLTALAILLAVGLTAALVSNRLNRHKIDELESARALARQRLQAASLGRDVEEFLRKAESCHLTSKERVALLM